MLGLLMGKREDLEPLVREFLDVSREVRRQRIRHRLRYAVLGIVVLGALFFWWASRLEPYDTAVAFTPDGSNLIITTEFDGLFFYNLSDLDNPIRKEDHDSHTVVTVVSPDGEMLATGSADYTIRLWDLTNLDQPSQVLGRHDNTVQHLTFSPDGQFLASAGFYGSEIKLWILNELNRPPQELSTGELNDLALIEFSSDGQHLVAVDKKEGVYLWQLSNLDNGPVFLIDTDN